MADTNVVQKDLGPVSAYAIAVKHGYKGTEEEWAALQIASAENAKAADASAKEAAETLAAVHDTVEQETTAAVAAVNNQETASIQSVKDAVQAAGAYQEERIAVKGEQTLASIPDDYTKLGQDVATLTEEMADKPDRDEVESWFGGFTMPTKNMFNPARVVKGKYASATTGELLDNAVLATYSFVLPNNQKMLVTCNLDGSETRVYREAVRSHAIVDANGVFVSGNNNEFTAYQYSNTTGADVVVWVNLWGDGNTYHTAENYMIELLELDAPLAISLYEPYGLMPDDSRLPNIPDFLPNAKRLFAGEVDKTVDSILGHMDEVNLSFAFVTDTHLAPGNADSIRQVQDTFSNLKAVLERIPVDGVFHAGDYLTTTWGGEDQHDTDVYINRIRAWMLNGHDRVYMALGNHDGVNGAPPTTSVYAAAMSHNEEYVVRDGDNPYYYIDHQKPKVRIIVLNTNDGVYGVSNDELAWLTGAMNSVPDGYKVIVVSHIAPSSEDFKTNKDQVIALLNQSGNVIAWICGHAHYDWTVPTSKSGCNFPVIISTCAMTGYSTPSADDIANGAVNVNSRVDKTVTQDSWSIFVYRPDEGKIHLVRFGAGDDRTIDYANWDTTK